MGCVKNPRIEDEEPSFIHIDSEQTFVNAIALMHNQSTRHTPFLAIHVFDGKPTVFNFGYSGLQRENPQPQPAPRIPAVSKPKGVPDSGSQPAAEPHPTTEHSMLSPSLAIPKPSPPPPLTPVTTLSPPPTSSPNPAQAPAPARPSDVNLVEHPRAQYQEVGKDVQDLEPRLLATSTPAPGVDFAEPSKTQLPGARENGYNSESSTSIDAPHVAILQDVQMQDLPESEPVTSSSLPQKATDVEVQMLDRPISSVNADVHQSEPSMSDTLLPKSAGADGMIPIQPDPTTAQSIEIAPSGAIDDRSPSTTSEALEEQVADKKGKGKAPAKEDDDSEDDYEPGSVYSDGGEGGESDDLYNSDDDMSNLSTKQPRRFLDKKRDNKRLTTNSNTNPAGPLPENLESDTSTDDNEELKKKLMNESRRDTDSYYNEVDANDDAIEKLQESRPKQAEGEDEYCFQDRIDEWRRMMAMYNTLK
jgi:hypothetical protein